LGKGRCGCPKVVNSTLIAQLKIHIQFLKCKWNLVWRRWVVLKVFPNLSSPCALALTCEKSLVCLYKQPIAITNKRRNNLVFWVSISLTLFLCLGNLWSYETTCRSYSKQKICMSGINNDDVHKSVNPSTMSRCCLEAKDV
jgi:hypothetical protein